MSLLYDVCRCTAVAGCPYRAGCARYMDRPNVTLSWSDFSEGVSWEKDCPSFIQYDFDTYK